MKHTRYFAFCLAVTGLAVGCTVDEPKWGACELVASLTGPLYELQHLRRLQRLRSQSRWSQQYGSWRASGSAGQILNF